MLAALALPSSKVQTNALRPLKARVLVGLACSRTAPDCRYGVPTDIKRVKVEMSTNTGRAIIEKHFKIGPGFIEEGILLDEEEATYENH